MSKDDNIKKIIYMELNIFVSSLSNKYDLDEINVEKMLLVLLKDSCD